MMVMDDPRKTLDRRITAAVRCVIAAARGASASARAEDVVQRCVDVLWEELPELAQLAPPPLEVHHVLPEGFHREALAE
jgi:hypothetical protein